MLYSNSILLLLLSTLTLALPTPSSPSYQDSSLVPDSLLLKRRPGTSPSNAITLLTKYHNGKENKTISFLYNRDPDSAGTTTSLNAFILPIGNGTHLPSDAPAGTVVLAGLEMPSDQDSLNFKIPLSEYCGAFELHLLELQDLGILESVISKIDINCDTS